jgi:hypothetical protein
MNRIFAVFLLFPLSAAAADWRYDGQLVAGGETATAESQVAASGTMGFAGPAPAEAPRGSMTMSAVRAAKGDPDRILDAVGDPPITRWQYPGYVVYFEHDRVITSVAGQW